MPPVTIDALVGRGWRALADTRRRISRRGSAAPALRSFGAPPRHDLETWNRVTASEFDRYRAEHPPASGAVAIVCVSCRPQLLDAVARNVARQCDVDAHLVFVANDPAFDGVNVESRFAGLSTVTVLAPQPDVSIGAGLNLALAATDARFVAKFDDDDTYGSRYLVDSLRAHGYAGAAVVGKHSYYADLASTGRRYLRFGGHDFAYTSTLAGGTLVIDRERTGDTVFDDVSLGEDRRFVAQCNRRGWSTFAADRFNFVQWRGGENTWRTTDAQFLAGCVAVDATSETHRVER